jgi:hypothetical protein
MHQSGKQRTKTEERKGTGQIAEKDICNLITQKQNHGHVPYVY